MGSGYWDSRAKKALDEAGVKVQETIKLLSEIVIDRCEGTGYMQDSFFSDLRRVLDKLIDARALIK